MLKSMKIPRKLALSFLVICVSAAVMMMVFFQNVSMIKSATAGNNFSQSIHAQVLTLETALLRQNSQMRGFLVTSDASYLKSYGEARDEYDRTSAELESRLGDPAQQSAVKQSREATLAWRKDWGDRLIAQVQNGQREAAQSAVRAAGKAVLVTDAVLPLRGIRDYEAKLIEENSQRQESAIATAISVLVIGGIALIGIAITLAVVLSRVIALPISRLTATMANLAAGRHDITVPDTDRGDELGDMARAVLIFRDAAVVKVAAEAEKSANDATVQMVVETLGASLSELSSRDLTTRVTADYPGVYAALKSNYNDALDSVRATVQQVSEGAANIRVGSEEIAQASEDLARRTESNAASLEQTSAALVEIEGRLRRTATSAKGTVARADQAIASVGTGRTTAEGAMQAMTRVSSSAKGIDSVIEGVDKIAFQTRVLAMNAAVEAGRAGDAGRGFAVVADLVSALAMRAEEEAKRARDQLTVTQAEIVTAVDAVQRVDGALSDIAGDVDAVHQLLASMADDNLAQAAAITQISSAVGSMDKATQQNAAMVEQTSAAARSLTQEVGNLSTAAAQFNIQSGRVSGISHRPSVAVTALPRKAPRQSVRGNGVAATAARAAESSEWADF